MSTITELETLSQLQKDLRAAATNLQPRETRYLVDLYYQIQDYRISSANQARSMSRHGEPIELIDFFGDQMRTLERQLQRVLDVWTDEHELGRWCKSITGIGPVITAGLLAHIDIRKCRSAGSIWTFAGIQGNERWERGQKRPWNARLKVICWKIGESFVKVKSHRNDFYGRLYEERKEYENERNEAVERVPDGVTIIRDHANPYHGHFVRNGEMIDCYRIVDTWYFGGNARACSDKLRNFRIGRHTDAYKAYSIGKLPPAHIHARAKRWAVKIFLSHFFEVGYEIEYGRRAPMPYAVAHLDHKDIIAPPNWP